MKKLIFTIYLMVLFIFSANAHHPQQRTREARIDAREVGISKREALKLRKEKQRIKQARRQFIANDGRISRREACALNTAQRHHRRNIQRQRLDQNRF